MRMSWLFFYWEGIYVFHDCAGNTSNYSIRHYLCSDYDDVCEGVAESGHHLVGPAQGAALPHRTGRYQDPGFGAC